MPPGEDRATATGICIQNFVKISPAVPEICSCTDRQTHRQKDRHTNKRTDRRVDHNTPHL